jgi:3-deoxy-D-manno-octulosonic-acid transferase
MLFVYRILINLILILSPVILIIRIIKKKENIKRFKEKFGLFSEKRKNGNLIWFHGASVGEIQSIVPLLEKFEKNKKINQILITSNTLSSSKIVEKIKLKKITHQFFPIDTNIISNNFINYWRPSKAFFIDSEIWPNTIFNLKKKKIPIVLINGRISKKSYQRWLILSNFSKKIFSNFSLCLSSSLESLSYLKNLNAKNVKFIGNLKFSGTEKENSSINNKLKKFFKTKKIWSASSTHQSEELFCGLVHLELKKKIKNLLTIIIPRHVERSMEIKNDLEKLNLIVHLDEPKKRISPKTDVYLVNSYGKTKSFYKYCKNVFLGGSIIKHGGQNPIEAVRFGCSVLHGSNIDNFREIYEFLKKNKISYKTTNKKDLTYNLIKLFSKENKSKKIQKKIKLIGNQILKKTYNEICF